ncbi:MAG: insulinase family protein [Oscillospiraceae bacterium]|nr:insulinase family protein [Oscillospiraceae bacterium]
MTNSLRREKIADGAHFNAVSDPRFKFNRITFGFLTPLCKEKASLYALIPRVLHDTNANFPSMKDLSNFLASLYNAQTYFEACALGDTQFLSISMNFMDDSYALHGESIAVTAVNTLFDCLFHPVVENGGFSPATVENCKRLQIEAIESELNDKRVYASNQAKRIICEGEPAAVNPLGDAENTRAVTPEALYEAYCGLLKNAEIEIICVGCNDFTDALAIAKKEFTSIERVNIIPSESAYSPLKSAIAEKTELLPLLNQSKMVLGFKTSSTSKNSHPALYLMSLLYGGTISSKLFLNVRERLSLCYYCWSQIQTTKGFMSVSCGVEEANIEKAKAEIIAQLESVKKGDFTDDDLTAALLYEQNFIKTSSDSLTSLTAFYLKRIYMKDIKSLEEYLKSYDSVTREDIIEAANSMTLDTIYILSGVGDDVLGVPQEEGDE